MPMALFEIGQQAKEFLPPLFLLELKFGPAIATLTKLNSQSLQTSESFRMQPSSASLRALLLQPVGQTAATPTRWDIAVTVSLLKITEYLEHLTPAWNPALFFWRCERAFHNSPLKARSRMV